MVLLRKVLLVLLLFLPTTVFAEWRTDLQGPDVFGEKSGTVWVVLNTSKDILRGECNSNGKYHLNWLIQTLEPITDVRSLSGTLVMKTNSGAALSLAATLRAWNQDYVALSSINDPKSLEFLKVVSNASGNIELGYLIPDIDNKVSGSATTQGSRLNINKFIEHCGI